MNIIEIKDLNRYFGEGENRVHILKNVSLNIEKGDFVAIIGQSGSGKSTLMNIIGCLDTTTSGSYKINGKETIELSKDQLSDLRSQKFGFIFQCYNLLSSLTAAENVALPAIYAGMSQEKRLSRAKQLLEKLGLGDKWQNKPSQLSGGQQQRVSIARALMNGGEIILADEPTGALDSQSGQNVMEILRQLHAEGHTIIMVTHDREIAASANRVIEIKDGEIIGDTQKEAVKSAVENQAKSKPHFGFSKDQFVEAFRMSVSAIIAHKMRSLLTMLGIIIGITSVIVIMTLSVGIQRSVADSISGTGAQDMQLMVLSSDELRQQQGGGDGGHDCGTPQGDEGDAAVGAQCRQDRHLVRGRAQPVGDRGQDPACGAVDDAGVEGGTGLGLLSPGQGPDVLSDGGGTSRGAHEASP